MAMPPFFKVGSDAAKKAIEAFEAEAKTKAAASTANGVDVKIPLKEVKTGGIKCMYLMRGAIGTGKSTLANCLADKFTELGFSVVICSADHYFTDPETGEFVFDGARIQQAHDACKIKFRKAIQNAVDVVIVDNTNLEVQYVETYIQRAAEAGYQMKQVVLQCPNDTFAVTFLDRSKVNEMQPGSVTETKAIEYAKRLPNNGVDVTTFVARLNAKSKTPVTIVTICVPPRGIKRLKAVSKVSIVAKKNNYRKR
jgi:hypothetical protein